MEIQPLKYQSLPGLSERQLLEHHDILYTGYVKKVDEIRHTLASVDLGVANSTYSELRELKTEEGYALDAVKLHELYFNNMGGDGTLTEKMEEIIRNSFGTVAKWRKELIACGMSARGWVVLALDEDNKLHHYICDAHNQGGIWNAIPLLVLDVYEHAYFIDYGTDRKGYLEAFLGVIDWQRIEDRI